MVKGLAIYTKKEMDDMTVSLREAQNEANDLKIQLSNSPKNNVKELAELKIKYEAELTKSLNLTNQMTALEADNDALTSHIAELGKVCPDPEKATVNQPNTSDTESRFKAIETQIATIAATMASFANAVNIQTHNLNKPTAANKPSVKQQQGKPMAKPVIVRQPNRARSASQPPPSKGAIPKQRPGTAPGKPPAAKAQAKQPAKTDLSNRTFASIVANTASALQPKRIVQRNPDTTAEQFNLIKLDRTFNITDIKEVTGDKFTVLFNSNAQAAAFDEGFMEKHGERASSVAPRTVSPQFKITGPFGQLSIEDIVSAIINQNDHINADNIQFVRRYASGMLETIIFKCDQLVLNTIVNKGSILFGLQSIRCHEVIEILQCSKCCAYGHTMIKCQSPQQICKICSKGHKHVNCPTPNAPCCINCVNTPASTNTPIPTNHRATHDRCPIRMARLQIVKNKLSKQ